MSELKRVHRLNTDRCGAFREYAEKGCTVWIFGVSTFDHFTSRWHGCAEFTLTINLNHLRAARPGCRGDHPSSSCFPLLFPFDLLEIAHSLWIVAVWPLEPVQPDPLGSRWQPRNGSPPSLKPHAVSINSQRLPLCSLRRSSPAGSPKAPISRCLSNWMGNIYLYVSVWAFLSGTRWKHLESLVH